MLLLPQLLPQCLFTNWYWIQLLAKCQLFILWPHQPFQDNVLCITNLLHTRWTTYEDYLIRIITEKNVLRLDCGQHKAKHVYPHVFDTMGGLTNYVIVTLHKFNKNITSHEAKTHTETNSHWSAPDIFHKRISVFLEHSFTARLLNHELII